MHAVLQELCADEEAADHVQQQLEQEGRKGGLKGFEVVKKVHLTAEEFSVENDLVRAPALAVSVLRSDTATRCLSTAWLRSDAVYTSAHEVAVRQHHLQT